MSSHSLHPIPLDVTMPWAFMEKFFYCSFFEIQVFIYMGLWVIFFEHLSCAINSK